MTNTHDLILFSVGAIVGAACAGAVLIKLLTYESKRIKEEYCECEAPNWLEVGETGIVFCKKCFKDKKQ